MGTLSNFHHLANPWVWPSLLCTCFELVVALHVQEGDK